MAKSAPSQHSWVFMGDGEPEYGQLVVINFTANWTRLRLCYFDNYETWAERNPEYASDIGEDELSEGHIGGWFTESDDPNDWWERTVVSYWLPIEALPQQGPSLSENQK